MAAIKQCLEEDLDPTCFDQESDLGGLWRYMPQAQTPNGTVHSSVYDSTVVNTSKEYVPCTLIKRVE